MPSNLYKYASLEKDNSTGKINIIDSIENEYMWMARGDTLNDPIDSLKFMHQLDIQKEIYEELRKAGVENVSPEEIDISDKNKMQSIKKSIKDRYGVNSSQNKAANDWLGDEDLPGNVNQLLREMRESTYIHSFSEDYTFPLMWTYYANNHSGVCIQYDIKKDEKLSNCIFPVYYAESPYYYDDFMKEFLYYLKSREEKKSHSLEIMNRREVQDIIVKSSPWRHESEWRLITFGKPKVGYDKLSESSFLFAAEKNLLGKGFCWPTKAISAVYLGLNIIEAHKDIILKLASEKSFQVYQVTQENNSYELNTKKLTN